MQADKHIQSIYTHCLNRNTSFIDISRLMCSESEELKKNTHTEKHETQSSLQAFGTRIKQSSSKETATSSKGMMGHFV